MDARHVYHRFFRIFYIFYYRENININSIIEKKEKRKRKIIAFVKSADNTEHLCGMNIAGPNHTNHTELNIINLIEFPLTMAQESVLRMGLGFSPSQEIDMMETIKDLYLFARNLTYKFMFDPERKEKRTEREISEQLKNIGNNHSQ